MLISILLDILQKQLKYLNDSLKKCLDRRSKLTKSVAPVSSLPKCNYFEVMQSLHDKAANKPTESNLCLLKLHTACFRKTELYHCYQRNIKRKPSRKEKK